MMPPKLADLIPETHRKRVIFAHTRDGEIVSVKEVQNGLRCNCYCPQCSARLVAKNRSTEHVIAHFAHLPGHSNDACKSAGETALHKLAKDILAK